MSVRNRRKWPVTIKRGGTSVKIYKGIRRKETTRPDGKKTVRTYDEYRVAYYDEHRRRRFEGFADFGNAERRANEVLAMPTCGDGKLQVLTPADRDIYLTASEAVKPTGVRLDMAAIEYAAAKRLIANQDLRVVAQDYADTHQGIQKRTVEQVVEEFIRLREKRTSRGKPASDAYLHDLEVRLRPLGEAFVKPIQSVSATEIEEYVDSLDPGARSRHNLLRTIRTLFLFAQARRYYPRGRNPMEGIEMAFIHESEIGIFTPTEMRRLISAAERSFPDLLPFLVIGAFAGLRSAEIGRLDWVNVRAEHIEVTAAKAKTRSRRLVPIQPNLAAWLAELRKDSGRIVDMELIAHGFGALTAATEIKGTGKKPELPAVKWQPNGLRHSFCTYRLALTKNENLVATEAGNSPQMIHRHYRELATDQGASAWFSICP